MSLQQHDEAVLEGFGGPIFPDEVAELNSHFSGSNWCGALLKSLGRGIFGYAGSEGCKTSDGYMWFCDLVFRSCVTPVTVCVLFPWKADWDAGDDSSQDRSIAVYTRWGGPTFEFDFYKRIADWFVSCYTNYICKRILKHMRHQSLCNAS